MNRKTRILLVASALLIGALTSSTALAARGSADFTRYVALGDSLAAGSTSANPLNLVETHQKWSFPAVIARQAGTPDFQQPLVSEPGILPELALQSLVPLVIGPKSTGSGVPINLNLPRPYNNLGVPGATVGETVRFDGREVVLNPMFSIILRGIATAPQQALALQPTFISVWIGNNDVLGAVTSGTPAALTPIDSFTADYQEILDTLIAGAPNAGMITATVPPVTAVPFVNTVPPFLVDPVTRQPIRNPADGSLIFYIADLGGGNFGQLGPDSKVTLRAQPYLATGYGIPAALAPFLPPLPDIGKPLPDSVVLTAAELTQIEQRRQEVNALIQTAATSRNIPVVDADQFFARLAAGLQFAGLEVNTSYITGGIISLDGFHPTDIGYTLIANEFIRSINTAYQSNIPLASLTTFLENQPEGSLSLLGLPSWLSLNILEAPWTEFVGPFVLESTSTPEPPPAAPTVPRRGFGAGGIGGGID